MATRNEIIDKGFSLNKSVEGTNKVLAKYGYNPMGPREEGLYRTKRWGTSPVERLKKDAQDFTSGLNTILTMGADYGYNVYKDPVGTLSKTGSDVVNYLNNKGVLGLAKDAVSLLGQPYGLTEKDIQERGLTNVAKTLPGYMWSHPGFTTLDFLLPAMGKGPKHAVGDMLEKAKAPEGIRQFIPSTSRSKVNDAINSGRGQVSAVEKAMIRKLSEATNMSKVDMGQVARNLQAPAKGKWVGNAETIKATEAMKSVAKEYNKSLVELGVDPSKAKLNAQTQYILENLNPKRENNLVAVDIENVLKGTNKGIKGVSPEQFNKLANEASNLYEQGIITPLSHRATFKYNVERPGLVTKEDKALRNLADRKYGWATPEELGPTLFKAYEDTARDIYNANVGKISVDNIAKSIGEKTTVDRLKEGRPLLDSEVVISPRAFNDTMSKDFNANVWNSTSKRLTGLTQKGLDKTLWKDYADDLYVVKKDSLRPLENMAKSMVEPSFFGRTGRKVASTWKTAQLITPKYLAENRLGNWSLNFLEGVKLKDYLDAMKLNLNGKNLFTGKYNEIRPERLKADTSYYGVLGEEFKGTGASQALKQASRNILQGLKEKDIKKIFRGTFDFPSAPVLSLESQLEGLDRYANFIRQAKRLSEETGESVENIIKRTSKDSALYDKLMGQVNRSLGDYIGRNWSIDPGIYEGLSFAFPFFKYPTQAVRTLTHQAMTRPENFATRVTLPQRIGSQVWNKQVAQYPQLEGLEGGLVDHQAPGKYGYLHLHQSDVHPLGAGAGLIASGLSDWQNINISPFFGLSRIPNFLDRYGNTASSPKYYNAGGQTFVRDLRTGLPTRKLAEPGLGDRLSYGASWIGNTYAPPIIAWNRYFGPGIATAIGQTWYPNYDTSILGQIGEGKIPSWLQPIISGKTDRPGKKYPDTVLNQLGIRTLKVYPKQQASARSYQMAIKKYRKNQMMKNIKED